ncbi:MAG: VPS10 domain-containing protein, partial [Anaerolineae bacterium]
RILTDTERSVAYVDVDGSSERAYVGRRYMNLHATSLLLAGREYTARIDSLSGPLRVDPGPGRVYLSVAGEEEGYLLVLEAESLDLLAALPIDGSYSLRALDPERHLLYLARDGGQVQIWSATGGALPAPVEPERADLPVDQVTQLHVGPGGSPLLAGSLYLSTDGGEGWHYIGAGLPQRGVAHVAISPAYEEDRTLFVALAATDEGLGIWRSTDGGRSWRLASAGLSDLAVVDLAISPDFADDGTLFATTRKQGLFRSTDGGGHWTRLTERYFDPAGYNEPPALVVLSPAYGRDSTLFVVHDGLHRSTDGGESWVTLSLEAPGSLALSPQFAEDGTLYGWFGAAGVLRSTDRGRSWQPVSQGLALSSFGTGRLLLPQATAAGEQALYFIWSPSMLDQQARVYRSTDGGETWQQPAGEVQQGLTPMQLAAGGDALLALDGAGQLARQPVDEVGWQPVAAPPVAEVQFYDLALAPDFASSRTLYAAGQGDDVYHSGDAGLTWQPTGYPLRPGSVEPQPLLVLPGEGGADVVLVGSELGLYRYESGPGVAPDVGAWQAVEGGLPAGRSATTPWTGADGSLRLLSGLPEEEQRVYLSTDGGESWTSPLPPLPVPGIAEDLWLSPGLAEDGTAFFTGAANRPLRTAEGGAWREIGPPGEWLLSAFQMSPAFDRDGLLFLRTDGLALWRSTDGGDNWQALDGPWGQEPATGIAPEQGYRLPAVTFSPAYAADGVLLTQAGSGLYRSTDEGARWAQVLAPGSRFVRAIFSPDYARDGIIYLRQGAALYRSDDRGASWQPLPAPPWGEGDEIQLTISPTFGRDRTLLAWSLSGAMLISRDGGRSWQGAGGGLPAMAIRRPVFSPDHATDGLIYLLPHAAGMYKRVGDGPWLPVTQAVSPPTVEPPTPVPPTATP